MAEKKTQTNPNVIDEEAAKGPGEIERMQHPDRFGGPISDEQDEQGNSVNLDVEPDPTKGPDDK